MGERIPYDIEIKNLSQSLLTIDFSIEDSKSFLMAGFSRKKKQIRGCSSHCFKLYLYPKYIGTLLLPKSKIVLSGPISKEVHDYNLNRGVIVLPVEKKTDM